MYNVYVSTNRSHGIDVYGKTLHDIMTLAWPLVLQWKRESAKHPETEIKFTVGNVAWGIEIKRIKRDQLDLNLRQMLGYRLAA